MQSILQILKVNEPRSGIKDGRPWSMQDAECVLIKETGEYDQVGVLRLPRELSGDKAPQPGRYIGSFALAAGMKDRRIEAVLTGLRPYDIKAPKAA